MAHDHHHHGESKNEYYVEQLFTILVCGALGVVAIEMYRTNMLRFVLAPQFHVPVLVGGIAIVVLVALRAIALWRETSVDHAHDHDHSHAHDHGHDHHHHHDHGHTHDHNHHHHSHDDHGHSHDLSWTFARLLVIAFPVALYLLGVPNAGLSKDRIEDLLGKTQAVGQGVNFNNAKEGVPVAEMRFNDLNGAAYDPEKRESLQGNPVIIVGRFKRIDDKEFTLYKLKMTCCVADTVPLKVNIVTKQALSGFKDHEWVQVKGVIDFVKVGNHYVPLIKVPDLTDIKSIPEQSDYE